MKTCISHRTGDARKNCHLAAAMFALSGLSFVFAAVFTDNPHHWGFAAPAVLMFLSALLWYRKGRAA